ncbi:hypothetical protein CIRG_03355 [Coccidioides immitis RMSCC 2394]|uniref:Uncharacterized protein n=1 Tax=Coccidioides immitis RMSCC 2394 TaxID=404692 RepID=A0A0J6YA58_COCIT|nr:hypothetical protein CIRG_03355 [Coccidioides immitis RMSCC 2394]
MSTTTGAREATKVVLLPGQLPGYSQDESRTEASLRGNTYFLPLQLLRLWEVTLIRQCRIKFGRTQMRRRREVRISTREDSYVERNSTPVICSTSYLFILLLWFASYMSRFTLNTIVWR